MAQQGSSFFFLLLFAVFVGGGLFATDSHAYEFYTDGCDTCHGNFTNSTSPKGTVFGGNNMKRTEVLPSWGRIAGFAI